MAEYKCTPTDDDEAENGSFEQHEPFLPHERQESKLGTSRWCLTAKVLTVFNVFLALFLLWNTVQLRRNYNCVPGPPPPWCEYELPHCDVKPSCMLIDHMMHSARTRRWSNSKHQHEIQTREDFSIRNVGRSRGSMERLGGR
jgi:hypothetical protein